MLNPRYEFLSRFENMSGAKSLEIGPLNTPLIQKEKLSDGGQVFYLDHLSTDELREKYKDDESVDVSKIVPVDFVCADGDIIKATLGNTFDYVVASHVIEHAPNLLKFLSCIHSILTPGGSCIFIIPDKRFTFDINRPTTTFGIVLEKFLLEANHPNVAEVYDHFAMATQANGHNLWNGILDSQDTRLLVSEDFAWNAAHRVFDKQKYFDVHVNVFTPASFFSILKMAIKFEIIYFEVKQFLDTQAGQIEFMVCLQKPEDTSIVDHKLQCLASVPEFEIESLLSPYMPQVRALSNALESSSQLNLKLQNQLDQLSNDMRIEKNRLQSELDLALAMLDRRSVKFVLNLIHKLNKFF